MFSELRGCIHKIFALWDVMQRRLVATDVSGPVGIIFKDEAIQEECSMKRGWWGLGGIISDVSG